VLRSSVAYGPVRGHHRTTAGKLEEIVPGLRRVAVIFKPESAASGASYLHSVEAAAALLSVEATGAPLQLLEDGSPAQAFVTSDRP
jgi:hypothetical protein